MSAPKTAAPRRSWRDVIKIHPACSLFPPMSPEELRELGKDIRAHGLRNPIVLYREGDENDPEREGARGDQRCGRSGQIDELGIHLRNVFSCGVAGDDSSYRAGTAAGDRASFGRPVSGRNATQHYD